MNQFQFPEGYMSVTLFDTFALTGCPVMADSIPLSLDDDLCAKTKAHMNHHKDKVPSCFAITPTNLSQIPRGTKISFAKTVDFFWLFLSKFVCATTSKKQQTVYYPRQSL